MGSPRLWRAVCGATRHAGAPEIQLERSGLTAKVQRRKVLHTKSANCGSGQPIGAKENGPGQVRRERRRELIVQNFHSQQVHACGLRRPSIRFGHFKLLESHFEMR